MYRSEQPKAFRWFIPQLEEPFLRGNRSIMLEGNRLLEALAIGDRRLIEPLISEVNLQIGHSLFEAGEAINYCYFPSGAAGASYFVFLDEGDAVEATLVGPEGCIGGLISQGRYPAFTRAAVVHGGDFYRIMCRDL